MTRVAPWVQEITESVLGGPPFKIGDRVLHPSGRLVEIVGGSYWGEHGLSNYWEWRQVFPDESGSRTTRRKLGKKESGYGWTPKNV